MAMPQSETPEAIQKGVVKGHRLFHGNPQGFQLCRLLPYATEANLFVVTFAVVMNKEKWNFPAGRCQEGD